MTTINALTISAILKMDASTLTETQLLNAMTTTFAQTTLVIQLLDARITISHVPMMILAQTTLATPFWDANTQSLIALLSSLPLWTSKRETVMLPFAQRKEMDVMWTKFQAPRSTTARSAMETESLVSLDLAQELSLVFLLVS